VGNAETPEAGPSILIVEDHRSSRAALTRYLEAEGYRVIAVGRGGEALEVARNGAGTIDVALVNFSLPDTTGVRLVEELRGHCPDVGVVFMSGYSEARIAPRNGDRYLPKPLDIDAVLAVVDDITRNGSTS
jgi:DNA-binding response OmpR family regulator